MFVRITRSFIDCVGRKLLPNGAFGTSISPNNVMGIKFEFYGKKFSQKELPCIKKRKA